MSARDRRVAAASTAGVLVLLWMGTGTPWAPPTAGLATVVLVRLLGPALPNRLRRPGRSAVVVGSLVLLSEVSPWAWVLVGALVLVLTGGWQRGPHAGVRPRVLLLGAAMALAGGAGLTVEHLDDVHQAAEQNAQTSALSRAALLPPSPDQVARSLVNAVADGDTAGCGLLLTPQATDQLAATVGAPACPTTIRALSARVLDRQQYARPDADTITTTSTAADRATVDACHLTWGSSTVFGRPPTSPAPGPQLGYLDVARVLGRGYQITAVRTGAE